MEQNHNSAYFNKEMCIVEYGSFPPKFATYPHLIVNACAESAKIIEQETGELMAPWNLAPRCIDWLPNDEGKQLINTSTYSGWEYEESRKEFYSNWCDGRLIVDVPAVLIGFSSWLLLSEYRGATEYDYEWLDEALRNVGEILNVVPWYVRNIDPDADYWAFICHHDNSDLIDKLISAGRGKKIPLWQLHADGEKDALIWEVKN